MSKIGLVKNIVGLGVSLGVNSIVSGFIAGNIPSKIGRLQQITVGLGGMVLSSMVVDKAVAHAEKKIDDGIELIKKTAKEIEEEGI